MPSEETPYAEWIEHYRSLGYVPFDPQIIGEEKDATWAFSAMYLPSNNPVIRSRYTLQPPSRWPFYLLYAYLAFFAAVVTARQIGWMR